MATVSGRCAGTGPDPSSHLVPTGGTRISISQKKPHARRRRLLGSPSRPMRYGVINASRHLLVGPIYRWLLGGNNCRVPTFFLEKPNRRGAFACFPKPSHQTRGFSSFPLPSPATSPSSPLIVAHILLAHRHCDDGEPQAQDLFSQSPATSRPSVRRRGPASTAGSSPPVIEALPVMVFDAGDKLKVEDVPLAFEPVAATHRNQGDGAGARPATSST
ncbi:hypothetical protein PAHAL_3G315000 [Panicum hallii]|uniref:Uncharacterized protein n=1 Tax=Panicum hallii TaxID=206008 RepID=A0A2T8KK10_9POAL|nr:hypothetical protein PAHAL_3G315000 [Panicum hallii]